MRLLPIRSEKSASRHFQHSPIVVIFKTLVLEISLPLRKRCLLLEEKGDPRNLEISRMTAGGGED